MGRGWFLTESPWTGRLLSLSPSSASGRLLEERDGEDQGYAGKLSFFPFRTVRREKGAGMTIRPPAEGTASHSQSRGLHTWAGQRCEDSQPHDPGL